MVRSTVVAGTYVVLEVLDSCRDALLINGYGVNAYSGTYNT